MANEFQSASHVFAQNKIVAKGLVTYMILEATASAFIEELAGY